MYGTLYRQFWQLKKGSWGREIFHRVQEMRQRDYLSDEALRAFQFDQMRRLLVHAYYQVPFHRARMEAAGFNPIQMTALEEVTRLPFMTKEEIRQEGLNLVAQACHPQTLIENASGGSTGVPLRFYQDQRYTIFNRANKLYNRRYYGYQMGDKIAYLWGGRRDTTSKGLRQRLGRIFHREYWIDAFDLTPAQMSNFKNLLDQWQPRLLVAYPSALQAFATYAQNQGWQVRSPEAIECSAEKLQPAQRALFEKVFECPIYDVYGSREFGLVAAERQTGDGLHVLADSFYVEIIKDGQPAKPGEVGEIAITCFGNLVMPFIRYLIGDLGCMAPDFDSQACSRPRLAEVIGRTNGVVSTPDGKIVHGAFFSKFFYNLAGVNRYRVHQVAIDKLDILVESNGQFTPEQAVILVREIQAKLGGHLQVSCQITPKIQPLPSGKLAYLVSDVPVNFAKK